MHHVMYSYGLLTYIHKYHCGVILMATKPTSRAHLCVTLHPYQVSRIPSYVLPFAFQARHHVRPHAPPLAQPLAQPLARDEVSQEVTDTNINMKPMLTLPFFRIVFSWFTLSIWILCTLMLFTCYWYQWYLWVKGDNKPYVFISCMLTLGLCIYQLALSFAFQNMVDRLYHRLAKGFYEHVDIVMLHKQMMTTKELWMNLELSYATNMTNWVKQTSFVIITFGMMYGLLNDPLTGSFFVYVIPIFFACVLPFLCILLYRLVPIYYQMIQCRTKHRKEMQTMISDLKMVRVHGNPCYFFLEKQATSIEKCSQSDFQLFTVYGLVQWLLDIMTSLIVLFTGIYVVIMKESFKPSHIGILFVGSCVQKYNIQEALFYFLQCLENVETIRVLRATTLQPLPMKIHTLSGMKYDMDKNGDLRLSRVEWYPFFRQFTIEFPSKTTTGIRCARTHDICLNLMRILRGMSIVDSGDILLDGINIDHVELSTLQRLILYIPKYPILLEGSILDNLSPESELYAANMDWID